MFYKALSLGFLCCFPILMKAQDAPRWAIERTMRVGEPGSVEFDQIVTMAAGANGEAFVLAGSSPFIRVIGRNGRVIRQMGRLGSGPGEFRQPRGLGWIGDTLWVSDPVQRRITFFPGGRNPATTLAFSAKLSTPFSEADPLTVTPDGKIVIGAKSHQVYDGRWNGLPEVVQAAVFLATKEGAILRQLALYQETSPVFRARANIRGQTGAVFLQQPFRDDPILATYRDGTGLVIVRRDISKSTFTVTRLSQQGDTVFSRQVSYRPRVLDEQTYNTALERLLHPQFGPVSASVDEEELRGRVFRPRVMTPVESVVPTKDRRIWLRRETTASTSYVDYYVLDPLGTLEAIVPMPSGDRVVESDGTWIWAIGEGTSNVPTLSLYRIVRPRR